MATGRLSRARRSLALHLIAFVLGGAALHLSGLARPEPARATKTTDTAQGEPRDAAVEGPEAKPPEAPNEEPTAPILAALALDDVEQEAPAAEPEPVLTPQQRALGVQYTDGQIITGSTPHRLILFTFDDGPDPRTTPLLLDRLDEAGIKAVFFLVASRMAMTNPSERHQAEIAREIARRGHIIGGHTLTHAQLPLLDDAAVKHQLDASEAIFQKVLGGKPMLFRPPFGAHSQRIDQHLAAHRYTPVLWNLGAGDFQVRTTDEVFDTWLKVLERRERENGDRGGIVLLHDTYAWSVDAFERIVAHLLTRNCELLDRNEELYDFVDDLSFFYVPRGDAGAQAVAPPAVPPPDVLAARQAVLRERTARRCKSLASAY